MQTPEPNEVTWLVQHSMLHQARQLAARYAGQARLWQRPYAQARPRAASALASVWFTAYPASIVTRPGESVLHTLGDRALWQALAALGVQAIHIGPTKQAGGLSGQEFTPTVDGHFDRIGLTIDPTFGSQAEFIALTQAAAARGAIVIDDIIPGHTGKGADFRLAELRYGDYPGLYHMVEIPAEDWSLLPPVPAGRDAANLPPATVDLLKARGYIVGQLPRTIFYEPGVKETDWSATGVVVGVDGVARRWVYLHYFKAGQPTLNWLDPTFAAPQLVLGDALHSLDVLGARMLRLDANGFLGIEMRPDGPAWSEGHPLSILANQLIGGLVRKLGGFTFQELNLTVDDIAALSQGGADLSYDFITRPAYHHALVTGDTEFLRLMLRIMHEFAIDPASLIHGLQNHDELTLELVHFWSKHKDALYTFGGRNCTGSELREQIRTTMYERLTGENAPYNLPFVTNGVASTTASVVAAALGLRDLSRLTVDQIDQIQRAHLLLAMYNALQPGIFALSGWDLVGALPLPPGMVESLLADGDTRWINRGAYDLAGVNPTATASHAGLPKATALYGPLTEQLQRPDSFASQLQRLLAVRQQYGIYASRQVEIPTVKDKALLVMVHDLPAGRGTQVTALNFGVGPIEEAVTISGAQPGPVVELVSGADEEPISATGQLSIRLAGYGGKAYLLAG
jgi:trehalose synthase